MGDIKFVEVRITDDKTTTFISEELYDKLKMKYFFAMSCLCRYQSVCLKDEAINAESQEVYKILSCDSENVFKRAKRWENYYENMKRKLKDENGQV